jgi:hypothetical protein
LDALTGALAAVIPQGAQFILVEDDQMGRFFPAQAALPFLERHGEYWGPPGDEATAIQELERLRRSGAAYIAFAWLAFWWLDYYKGFHDYLRANFRCLLQNERLVIFELRKQSCVSD